MPTPDEQRASRLSVSVRIADWRYRQTGRAGVINGPLDEPGCLRLLHEFIDVFEPSGMPLGNDDTIDIRSVVVFQNDVSRTT